MRRQRRLRLHHHRKQKNQQPPRLLQKLPQPQPRLKRQPLKRQQPQGQQRKTERQTCVIKPIKKPPKLLRQLLIQRKTVQRIKDIRKIRNRSAFETLECVDENSFKLKIRNYENSIRFSVADIQFLYC